MANHKYTNTVAAAAMSLGLDPVFLHEALDKLKEASKKHTQVAKQCTDIQIDISVYGFFKSEQQVIKPLGPHERRD